jgi:hypothetical protein
MSVESHGGMILTGETKELKRKTCPSATLYTTNPTWIDLGLRGERLATNCLSHGMAFKGSLIGRRIHTEIYFTGHKHFWHIITGS